MSTGPLALPVFLALLLAGCSGTAGPEGPGAAASASESGSGTAGPGGNATVRLGQPRSLDLFLTEQETLVPEAPAAGSLGAGTPAQAFATGLGPTILTFRSEPLDHAVLIEEDVAGTFYVQSAGPLVSNGAFDVAAWLGRPGFNALFTFDTHDPAVPPGSVIQYDLALAFGDKRGLVVPAGEPLELLFTADFSASQDAVLLLVGGDTPSKLDLTLRDYGIDPLEGLEEAELDAIAGQAGPGTQVDCDPSPGTTSLEHDIPVGADARSLRLALSASGATAPGIDLDMRLQDGATVVAATATPLPTEGIFLAEESLAGLQGKTLTLVVYACQHGQVPYEVRHWQALGPPPA